MKLPVHIQLNHIDAHYVVSLKPNGRYEAKLQGPVTQPDFILPLKIILHKAEDGWKFNHDLGVVIADAIDAYNLEF